MYWTRTRQIALVPVSALLLFGALSSGSDAPRATAQATGVDVVVPARIDWSVPPRFGVDANNNGLPDLLACATQTEACRNYVEAAAKLDVKLSACQTSQSEPITYEWSWSGPESGSVTRSQCDLDLRLSQGAYRVELRMSHGNGAISQTTADMNVKDYLIVTMGDSIASGEGNPEVRQRLNLVNKRVLAIAGWADGTDEARRCHRSTRSAPALVAKRMEEQGPVYPGADPDPAHSSVTFIHLACSGAKIAGDPGDGGILASYGGVEGGGPAFASQIDQLRSVLAGGSRPVDDLLMAIGANDFGFADYVRHCAIRANCEHSKTLASMLRNRKALLPRRFEALHRALTESFGESVPRVRILEYPDPTTGNSGRRNRFPGILIGIGSEELRWAANEVLRPLNDIIEAVAHRYGWWHVTGPASEFIGHGYPASSGRRWIVQAEESHRWQGPCPGGDCSLSRLDLAIALKDTRGTLHPNFDGHSSIAGAILRFMAMNERPTRPYRIRPKDTRWLSTDWNADGRTDLVHVWDGGINTLVAEAPGTYRVAHEGAMPRPGYRTSPMATLWLAGDVDSDGRGDLVHLTNAGIDALISTAPGGYRLAAEGRKPRDSYQMNINTTKEDRFRGKWPSRWIGADVDGDGRMDLIHVWDKGINTLVGRGDGTFRLAREAFRPRPSYRMNVALGPAKLPRSLWIAANVNADRRDDLVHLWPGGINTLLSNGDGTYRLAREGFVPRSGYGIAPGFTAWLPADTDADDRTDLLHLSEGGINTLRSSGDGGYGLIREGFKPRPGYGIGALVAPQHSPWLSGDVNGDERADLMHVWDGGINTLVGLADGTYNLVGEGFKPRLEG
jgi:hypothetical protein